MTSGFAPEVAKYRKSSPNPKMAQNSVRACCLAPLAMQLVQEGHESHKGMLVNEVNTVQYT